jgi:hypothetical protein
MTGSQPRIEPARKKERLNETINPIQALTPNPLAKNPSNDWC